MKTHLPQEAASMKQTPEPRDPGATPTGIERWCTACAWRGRKIDTRMFGKIAELCPECGADTADYLDVRTRAVRKGFWDVFDDDGSVYATVFNSLEAACYVLHGWRVVEQSNTAGSAKGGITKPSIAEWNAMPWAKQAPLAAHPADAGAVAVEQAIPMVLHCPKCGLQHIDAPEPRYADNGEDDTTWNNPPHRSHLCHGCNHIWRPADVPTEGVRAIGTRGKADSPLASQPQAAPLEATSEQMEGAQVAKGEPFSPTEQQFADWRERHGMRHTDREAFDDAASLYLEAAPTTERAAAPADHLSICNDDSFMAALDGYMDAVTADPDNRNTDRRVALRLAIFAAADAWVGVKSRVAEVEATSERKPLTDAEIAEVWQQLGGPDNWLKTFGLQQFARTIEQHHGIGSTPHPSPLPAHPATRAGGGIDRFKSRLRAAIEDSRAEDSEPPQGASEAKS